MQCAAELLRGCRFLIGFVGASPCRCFSGFPLWRYGVHSASTFRVAPHGLKARVRVLKANHPADSRAEKERAKPEKASRRGSTFEPACMELEDTFEGSGKCSKSNEVSESCRIVWLPARSHDASSSVFISILRPLELSVPPVGGEVNQELNQI